MNEKGERLAAFSRRQLISAGAGGIALLSIGRGLAASGVSEAGAAQVAAIRRARRSNVVLQIEAAPRIVAAPSAFAPASSEDVYKRILKKIFAWDLAAAHRYAWQDLPGQGNLVAYKEGADASAIRAAGPTGRPWQRYFFNDTELDRNAQLPVTVPAGISALLPGSCQICVPLDNGLVVPDYLAAIHSRGFAAAVAAGWMVNNFRTTAPKPFQSPDITTANGPALTNYGSYGTTLDAFKARADFLAEDVPVETQGIFQGWQAGTELYSSSADIQLAVKEAIFTRFDWEHLGLVTAHSLNYMLGFYRASAINPKGDPSPDSNVVSLATLRSWIDPSKEEGIASVEDTIADLLDALLPAAAHTKDPAVRSNLLSFMRGYNRGSIIASRDVFLEGVQLGYGIGYRFGFRNGYSRGYRDGYRAGFKDGLGNFLDDAVSVVNGIKGIADDVAKVAGVFAAIF